MALLGIAGRDAFLRAPNGQTGIVKVGDELGGIKLLQIGITECRATGALAFLPFAFALLADAERMAEQHDQAQSHLDEAERLMAETGDRFAEAELYRVRGELLRRGNDDATAEGCLLQAIAVAQNQCARFWELRATISLARLWSEQGKRDAARGLLTPIYGWFTEGLIRLF